MRFWVHTAEKCALPPGPLALEPWSCRPVWPQIEVCRVEDPILQETELAEPTIIYGINTPPIWMLVGYFV
jgi:hypothetical protein